MNPPIAPIEFSEGLKRHGVDRDVLASISRRGFVGVPLERAR